MASPLKPSPLRPFVNKRCILTLRGGAHIIGDLRLDLEPGVYPYSVGPFFWTGEGRHAFGVKSSHAADIVEIAECLDFDPRSLAPHPLSLRSDLAVPDHAPADAQETRLDALEQQVSRLRGQVALLISTHSHLLGPHPDSGC